MQWEVLSNRNKTAKMEKLLVEQKYDIDEILRTMSNYKKLGQDRRTKGQLQARRRTIEGFWSAIELRHKELEPFGMEDAAASQPYFLENTYEATKEAYITIMADIGERLRAHDEDEQLPTVASGAISKKKNQQAQPFVQHNIEQSSVNLDAFGAASHQNGTETIQQDDDLNNVETGDIFQQHLNNRNNERTNANQRNEHAFLPRNSTPQNELTMRYTELMDLLISSENLSDDASHGRIKIHIDSTIFIFSYY